MPAFPPYFYAFMTGATFSLCLVATILFARFYKRTLDRLFLFFSIAFGLLALNNLLFLFGTSTRFGEEPEDARHPLLYSVRLIAFAVIIFAIVDKNRLRTPRK